MPINKIVRVAEGIELTEELLANLKRILDVEKITIERPSDSPKLQKIYKKRIEILYQAFNFVLETTPLKPGSDLKLLKKYLVWCKAQCALPDEADIKIYQNLLSQYTALLIGGLLDYCDVTYSDTAKGAEEIAAELLNAAEEYVIMKKGGYDIVTLVQMDIYNPKDLVMLWDEQLPPCSEETLADLERIDKSPIQTTPQWFRQLPSEQQIYFHSIKNLDISIRDLKFQLNNFQLTTWPAIKALYEAKKTHSAVFQQSLKSIRDNVRLPAWFTALSFEQQRFLKQLITAKSEELGSNTTLLQDLAGIKEQRMPAWYSFINSDQQNFIGALFSSQNSTITDFELCIKKLEETFADIASKNSEKFVKDVENLRKLPYWFLTLENYEQRFLKTGIHQVSKETGKLADAVAFVPSRQRRVPGLANFRRLHSSILDIQGNTLEQHEPSYGFAHLVPRDELKKPQHVLDVHTRRNMKTVLQYGDFFIFQTLISPVRGNYPDYELEQQRQGVLRWVAETKKEVTIIPTNHALNFAKHFDYTTSDNPNCLLILKRAESFLLLNQLPELEGSWDESGIKELVAEAFSDLKKSPLDESKIKDKLIGFIKANIEKFQPSSNWQPVFVKHLSTLYRRESDVEGYAAYRQEQKDLAELAREYKSILNSGPGTATFRDYNGRELFLSTYERLLAPKIGAKICGGCVSCKDREWIVRCHTMAALVYQRKYGECPSLSDLGKKRENFVNIVADIFAWGHGFAGADKNAEGCFGTKHIDSYLPSDIVTAIKERVKNPSAIEIYNTLASNNEVAEIGNALDLIKPGFSKFIMQALKLSDENQLETLSRLSVVLQEKKYWQANISYMASFFKSGPNGIGQMQDRMNTRKERANRVFILADIYSDTQLLPKERSDRFDPTQRIYDCILELNAAPDPNAIVPDILKRLEQIKIEAYEYNSGIMKVGV